MVPMEEKVLEAADAIKARLTAQPEIGIVLGSGLGDIAGECKNSVSIRFEEIPHFPVSSIEGHHGVLVGGRLAGADLCAFSGRVHYYEGFPIEQVVFPIHVMAALGVQRVIITNAAGAVNDIYRPGDIAVICDHINLMGGHPTQGTNRFIGITDCYSGGMRKAARKVAADLGITLHPGIYAAVSGPSYETPAEIRALRTVGADMVGMSTVPEVIAANRLDMAVLGLSLITNMAAGVGAHPLSHQEVIDTGQQASGKFITLLKGIISALRGPQ
jgi:purine-nucleoside phosphorylase